MRTRDKYGNAVNFLKVFAPVNQSKYSLFKERCFIGTAPSLSLIKDSFGEGTAILSITNQLKDLSEYTGCKEKLSISQMDSIAGTILMNYWSLKITELMYFFQFFKGGRFGRFYGTVDGMVITSALYEFVKDVRNKILDDIEKEQRAIREAEERRRAEMNCMSHDEYEEIGWLFEMGYEKWRIDKELQYERDDRQNPCAKGFGRQESKACEPCEENG